MKNKPNNLEDWKMLLHAGVMMIFSGTLLAATVNIVYGVCLWAGAFICFIVAKKRDAEQRKNEECEKTESTLE